MTIKDKCLDYYIMCQPCLTPSSIAHKQCRAGPHTDTTLVGSRNNILLKYMSGQGVSSGCGAEPDTIYH